MEIHHVSGSIVLTVSVQCIRESVFVCDAWSVWDVCLCLYV